jgi:hypothetical protein
MLEMLCNVGKQQSVEEARHLTESLRNPRPEVLDTLLSHCTRIKVVRLARQFADELELPWAEIIHPHSQRMGSDRRWMLRYPQRRTPEPEEIMDRLSVAHF